MKILLFLSLLCINNVSAPPDTTKKDGQKTSPKQPPAATKPAPKKTSRVAMPLYPSPLLVDLL